jgi:hypothetical protein
METGILSETKLKGKTRQKRIKLWIFATSNDVDRISEPLRSRFVELFLDEYSSMNLWKLLVDYYGKITIYMLICLKKLHTRCGTQCNPKTSGMTSTCSDIDWLVDVHIKYGKKGKSIKNLHETDTAITNLKLP